jgi:type III secretory pathway component EscR
MNITPLTKKGLAVNGAFLVLNANAFVGIYLLSGAHNAWSFAFGALLAQVFSLTWFLLSVPLMQGPNFIAAAMGGFFVRVVLLCVSLLIAYKLLHLSMLWAAPSFLAVRFMLLLFEVFSGQSAMKNNR